MILNHLSCLFILRVLPPFRFSRYSALHCLHLQGYLLIDLLWRVHSHRIVLTLPLLIWCASCYILGRKHDLVIEWVFRIHLPSDRKLLILTISLSIGHFSIVCIVLQIDQSICRSSTRPSFLNLFTASQCNFATWRGVHLLMPYLRSLNIFRFSWRLELLVEKLWH